MAEESLTGIEVAKMILIYEMMLQALVDKGNELVRFMSPCMDPRHRTKDILISIDNNMQLSEEDKNYYRELVRTADDLWLHWRARHTVAGSDSMVFGINPTLGNPNA